MKGEVNVALSLNFDLPTIFQSDLKKLFETGIEYVGWKLRVHGAAFTLVGKIRHVVLLSIFFKA